MREYYFKNGEFIIENYDKQRVFSSFLPAIAGKKGISLWAFYVNRGQIMSSFGVKDKNGAILEFFPAYTAYEVINRIGFRTFVRINNNVHEIFANNSLKCKRRMKIKKEQVSIEEINYSLKLKVEVTYYTLPNENIAALIRNVKITNLAPYKRNIEILDGLSQIFPPHTEHGTFKVMSNLQRSWMEVIGLKETDTAFYKYSASTADSAEVNEVIEGNFYMSMVNGKKTKPIVDPVTIFGYDTSYERAINFVNNSLDNLLKINQYPVNKVLCGFTPVKITLNAKEVVRIDTIIGNIHSYDSYLNAIDRLLNVDYLNKKQEENAALISLMTKDVKTSTKNDLFNEYIEATFLDNMLRGGYPFNFKDDKQNDHIYYLFSRKHGDLERDYNWFNIENEFYSQGNGNFRDICQNRRNDSLINLDVKDYNLKYFMNLIQLDGYNPLGVNGATYSLKEDVDIDMLVKNNFNDRNDIMKKILSSKFTPGSILNGQINNNIIAKVSDETYIKNILGASKLNIEASFNEGYWCDHFTYLLDLYESYIKVYPDKIKETMFYDKTYNFFESHVYVKNRDEKIYLTKNNTIRQYDAIGNDEIKINKFNLKINQTNWAKNKDGNVITTNLISKFFLLAFTKFNLLDNMQIGIEMEANKPGWNDACNGLPGLFGSSVGETFETYRIVKMLVGLLDEYEREKLYLPKEFLAFVRETEKLLKEENDCFNYWDKAAALREKYRNYLHEGVSENIELSLVELKEIIDLMDKKLKAAINKAKNISQGIIPTFLVYEVSKYEKLNKKGYNGYELVKPLEFKLQIPPYFLEGPARLMKIDDDTTYLKNMYLKIKDSGIYDSELKMYKTSEPLDNVNNEFGRIRGFNKGWLERESNFMHMTYKYLYGLLNANLYDEFFKEIKTNMVCNMNPKLYGRSPLEHCSFIATSNNLDKNVHGQGFVARLSGSTAEMLSVYLYMMIGKQPFTYKNNILYFSLNPIITKKFFKEDHTLSFTLFSKIKVTYVNENNIDTYKGKVISYTLKNKNSSKTIDEIKNQDAIDIRNLKYDEIIAVIK